MGIKIGLFKSKKEYIKTSKVQEVSSCNKKEWYKLEHNTFAVDKVVSVFPKFSMDGLRDELVSFLTVYMMYLESRDDKYLSYFVCTDELRGSVQKAVLDIKTRVNYSNVEFKDFAIVGAEAKDDSFIITAEVSVFSVDMGSVTIGGKPLNIGMQSVYTMEYTVLKEVYNCCLDCNLVLESDSCDCGGSNVRSLNKKMVSSISVRKGA